LRPRVFGDFFRQYDQHPFPRRDLAINVLEGMGVPRGKADGVLDRIEDSAKWVGFIHTIKDKAYVNLSVIPVGKANEVPASIQNEAEENLPNEGGHSDTANKPSDSNAPPTTANERSIHVRGTAMTAAIADDIRRRRVFITHGKDRALVDPIKKLLEYGELEPVVSVERQSVSKPVPEKVLDDMRSAGAAIIHVDADHSITGTDGKEHKFLNSNVLIEIGAAMAFYGRRFILLVREGVALPSNLQGLYEVRYSGDTLDAHATIKLLEAMKDIKNYELPSQGEEDD